MTESTGRLTAALAGRYKIERRLGEGGMATVYLAEDLKHKRQVAVKVLRPELAAVLGAERFVQEITTTASLQHPHILPLFDSGEADSFLYYVMPYIEGETLRSKLDRETQLSIEEAVHIASDVADALDYAHRHGIIHRDIKPENILLHDGRPMVADFGIALAVSAAAGGRMTETGLSLGTPHYMSPEQATAEKEITARSDVYSLGSVLYEMLAGAPPHLGGSAQQIIMKIIAEDAAPVTSLRKSVPPNVAAAVAKSLEKLPADRFESAQAFAAALTTPSFSHVLAGQSVGAPPGVGRKWLVPILAAACTMLAIGLMWALNRAPAGVPTVYDVGLPDSAAMWTDRGVGFAVAPAGDFAIYRTIHEGRGELWYRSLMDDNARRIDGTEDAIGATISPDGARVAFIRVQNEVATVEVISVAGGSSTTLARTVPSALLEWLADDRILLVDGDGIRARWLDPESGSATVVGRIQYCILPTPLPDHNVFLCGGGGRKYAHTIDFRDSTSFEEWRTADSALVFGAHFRVVDDRYVVYLSAVGDLLAAPVDLSTRRVGRSVRLATGLGRRAYYGDGTFALAASGTLVYALGANGARGHMVSATGQSLDTLPVGREGFLRFSVSPDGRRLAAVVEAIDGEELRVYDLRSGSHVVWLARDDVGEPVWNPAGDRLTFAVGDSVFVGAISEVGDLALAFVYPRGFTGFSWLSDDRVVGVDWNGYIAISADFGQRPVVVDTILTGSSFVRPSPDWRWVAYSSADITTVWVEPFPRTGERYQAAVGSEDPQWLSSSEFVVETHTPPKGFDRIRVDRTADPPVSAAQRWIDAPLKLDTSGESFALTPDGRVVYVQGTEFQPVHYLRVIPHWVELMKKAVDEANR